MTRVRRRYRRGDLVLDLDAREARVRGRRVALTSQQLRILKILFEADGAVVQREEVQAHIAPLRGDASGRAVDLQISRLRRRLGDGPASARYIEAVYGLGYRLAPETNDPSGGRFAAEVFEALPDAVLVLDERLVIRDANQAAELLLGRERSELVGESCATAMECLACDGSSLAGTGCLGLAALRGETTTEVRGWVHGAKGPLPVVFAHVRVLPVEGVRLVTVSLRAA